MNVDNLVLLSDFSFFWLVLFNDNSLLIIDLVVVVISVEVGIKIYIFCVVL